MWDKRNGENVEDLENKGEDDIAALVEGERVLIFMGGKGKRKWECAWCGNLFKDGEALCRHVLKEEKKMKMKISEAND